MASDSSVPILGQQMVVQRQSHNQPILDPITLHSLCTRQGLIIIVWKRQRRRLRGGVIDTISRHCTCSRRSFASPSSSRSGFVLHEPHCPLYEAGQLTVGVAAKYSFCNRLLELSVSVMMTLTKGAGAFSVSPAIQFHGVVESDSPAYELVELALMSIRLKRDSENLDGFRYDLSELFRQKKAAPTDRLADGSTILLYIAQLLVGQYWHWSPGANDLESMRRLMFDVIEAGVSLNKRTVQDITVFDYFIQAWSFYVPNLQNDARPMSSKILRDLLISGNYMRSLNLALRTERHRSRHSSFPKKVV